VEARAFVYAVRNSDYTLDKLKCWLLFAARVDYEKERNSDKSLEKSNTQQEQRKREKKECKAPNELPLSRQNSAGEKGGRLISYIKERTVVKRNQVGPSHQCVNQQDLMGGSSFLVVSSSRQLTPSQLARAPTPWEAAG